MCPIPHFDGRGLLPPYEGTDETTSTRSPYPTTMREVVRRFGTSDHRRRLIKNLLAYRSVLHARGYDRGLQLVNGSFVEDVETREGRNPGDIDVFSFLVRPTKYKDNEALWRTTGILEWCDVIANRAMNKSRYQLDTYAIAVDQHNALGLIVETVYWSSLFAHKRVTHEWKGFLRIAIDAADDALASQSL